VTVLVNREEDAIDEEKDMMDKRMRSHQSGGQGTDIPLGVCHRADTAQGNQRQSDPPM